MSIATALVLFGAVVYYCGATNGETHLGGEMFGVAIAAMAAVAAIVIAKSVKVLLRVVSTFVAQQIGV